MAHANQSQYKRAESVENDLLSRRLESKIIISTKHTGPEQTSQSRYIGESHVQRSTHEYYLTSEHVAEYCSVRNWFRSDREHIENYVFT